MKIGVAALIVGVCLGLAFSPHETAAAPQGKTHILRLNDAVEIPALDLRCLHAFSGGGRAFYCWRQDATYMVWMRKFRIWITDRAPRPVYSHRW